MGFFTSFVVLEKKIGQERKLVVCSGWESFQVGDIFEGVEASDLVTEGEPDILRDGEDGPEAEGRDTPSWQGWIVAFSVGCRDCDRALGMGTFFRRGHLGWGVGAVNELCFNLGKMEQSLMILAQAAFWPLIL